MGARHRRAHRQLAGLDADRVEDVELAKAARKAPSQRLAAARARGTSAKDAWTVTSLVGRAKEIREFAIALGVAIVMAYAWARRAAKG